MKTGIHPNYYTEAKINCANCGHTFVTGGTKEEINVEICSKCHPFYTGKKMLIDTEGRIDKFRKKMDAAGGRKKKDRKKKTLEERVNQELQAQIGGKKEKAKKDEAKKAPKEAPKMEAPEVAVEAMAAPEVAAE